MSKSDLLQGTLDMLILKTLALEAMHGLGISRRICGVGVQSGQFITEKKVQAVLTGKVGPNASQTLQAAGIDVVVDVSGDVKSAVERFKNGELKPSLGPNADRKSGMNG